MNPPYYRVAKAFQETYHMRKGVAIHHLVICLSCGHWRRIKSTSVTYQVIGRLFSCKETHC